MLNRAGKAFLSLFGIRSEEQKMREHAANWLEVAEKVYHYRRDLLSGVLVEELQSHIGSLRVVLKERDNAAKLKLEIESLEEVLRRTGGAIYPKSALVENVEFFLVAAIVILGIRTYFVQPFKIPTNSMWPTYYGMTGENYPPGTEAPGFAARVFRFVAFGATRKEAIAPISGEVSAVVTENGAMAAIQRPGKKWLVFPTTVNEYTFYVGDRPATVRVPADFRGEFDRMVAETYFGTKAAFDAEWIRLARSGGLSARGTDRLDRVVRMPLGKTVKAGEPVLRFDLLTGDQLFVDRISYHFVRPKVGQGFVFRTGNIPGIAQFFGDQYYIKRLVGVPGDTLQIREPVLSRNGQPITGSDAFAKNASREGQYRGYFNGDPAGRANYLLSASEKLTVPPDHYFALGDNSGESSDGRYWGFVPAKDVAGRPLFIYYPFTRRWGPAR
jgi:signal peptidase I